MRLVNLLVLCLLMMYKGYFGCFCANVMENESDNLASNMMTYETTTLAASSTAATFTSPMETPKASSTASTTNISMSTTPAPNPSSGTWSVTEGNLTCILVKLDASFVVPYNTYNGKMLNSSSFSLPKNATSNGSCFSVDGLSQQITLSWKVDENIADSQNSLTLVFFRNLTGIEQFYLGEVKISIFPDTIHFPNTSLVEFIEGHRWNDSLYKTSVNNSYRCNAENIVLVPMDSGVANQSAVLRLSRVQFEAFRTEGDRSNNFSKAIDCPADGMLTSDIVPIAVGCALAALVVVVLIAYLIGRRRARQRGYQSV